MSKIIKKILNFQKRKNGNISILVLIMSMAIILLTTAMVGYIFHDIGFTELDKGELRALHFAESGLSNMYSNIDKYYNEDIPLPPSPYTGEIEADGKVQGSYTVSYEEYRDDGEFSGYIITSKGTDKSGVERIVKVKLAVNTSSSFNIYDYIYSGKEVSITGSGDIDVNGNFFINDNFKATGSGEENFENIIVRGDLTITGSNNTISGPIFVNGSLIVIGSGSVDSDYENPLIVVMGDIRKTGSGNIGTPEKKFEIYCGGEISIVGSGHIYYFLSEDKYTFDYPDFNVEEYISEFSDEINKPGSKYVISRSLTLNEDLIKDGPYHEGNANNWIHFYKDDNDNFILEIEGNIFVEDDIVIGENSKEYTIYYRRTGKLFSTADITVYSKLIPITITGESIIPPSSQDIEDVFPEESLLFLIADNNIDLDIQGADDDNSECSNPDVCIIGIASNQIDFKERGITVKGTLIAGEIKFCTGSGDKGKICYEEEILDYLPLDISQLVELGDFTFTQEEWQEAVSD